MTREQEAFRLRFLREQAKHFKGIADNAQAISEHTGAMKATLDELLRSVMAGKCGHCLLVDSKDMNDPYYRILTVLIDASPEGIDSFEIGRRAAILDHRRVPRLMGDMYAMNVAGRVNITQRTTRWIWEAVGCTCDLPF